MKPLIYAHEKGQGLAEYSLVLILVAVVVFAVLSLLGPVISNMFASLNSELNR
ncbi:MAG: pilus assembly protein [Chloroflexota bacterium]